MVAERLEFSLDGYYKRLSGLYDLDPEGLLQRNLSGDAVGGELQARYRLRDLFFSSLSVAVARATRGGALYDYDQPFSLNFAASWTFRPTWNIGLRYRYATGLPYTPAVDGIYDATTDRYTPVFGATNSARLPPY